MTMKATDQRWRVVVTYLAEAGEFDVKHFIDELHELHEIIERGPSWYTIKDIVIIH